MKWYFAGRVRHRPKLIEIAKILEGVGISISSDWIYQESLKPYVENLDKVQPFGKAVVGSILETDVFVLISDAEGTDMFIELGIALAKSATVGKIKIYIVGKHAKRSLMQNHPDIIHVGTFDELINCEGLHPHQPLPKLDIE